VVALVVFAGWQHEQAKLARKDAEAAAAAMTQLQQGLVQLQQGQAADSAAIQSMVASQAEAVHHASTIRQRVVTMGNSDERVQKWLDSALPDGGCMLDDTCPAGSAASAAQRGPAPALR
jgi:hypothetical protein